MSCRQSDARALCHTTLPISVLVSIVALSDWHTLATWRATSREFFTVVAVLLRRRYVAHVKAFVPHKVALLDDILREAGAIICGSTALHFFLPDPSWSPTTLDIYIPAETYRRFLFTVADPTGLNWRRIRRRRLKTRVGPRSPVDLDTVEEIQYDVHAHTLPNVPHKGAYSSDDDDRNSDNNYEAIDDPPQRDTYDRKQPNWIIGTGCRTVRRMISPNGRIIRAMCSSSNNPVTPLRDSFSSLLMNFMTPDACVCGFPSATLDRTGVTKYQGLSPSEQSYRKLYKKRGFRFEGPSLRNKLDPWHIAFFGARSLLAMDFRHNLADPLPELPVKYTVRGWVLSSEWKR